MLLNIRQLMDDATCDAVLEHRVLRQYCRMLLLGDFRVARDAKAPVQLAKDALVEVSVYLHAS